MEQGFEVMQESVGEGLLEGKRQGVDGRSTGKQWEQGTIGDKEPVAYC